MSVCVCVCVCVSMYVCVWVCVCYVYGCVCVFGECTCVPESISKKRQKSVLTPCMSIVTGVDQWTELLDWTA